MGLSIIKILPLKAKRQYLLTCKIRIYCLLALHGIIRIQINLSEWFSVISLSIFNQISWNFFETHWNFQGVRRIWLKNSTCKIWWELVENWPVKSVQIVHHGEFYHTYFALQTQKAVSAYFSNKQIQCLYVSIGAGYVDYFALVWSLSSLGCRVLLSTLAPLLALFWGYPGTRPERMSSWIRLLWTGLCEHSGQLQLYMYTRIYTVTRWLQLSRCVLDKTNLDIHGINRII